jgi:hypothetical protein
MEARLPPRQPESGVHKHSNPRQVEPLRKNIYLLSDLERALRLVEVEACLKIVVAFQLVSAGNQHEALFRIADQLCAELGHAEGEEDVHRACSPLRGSGGGASGELNPEDESLVATVRRGLAKVAAAAGAARSRGGDQSAVSAALDCAELVMRGELARGNATQLPALMPSFVFLVTLPIVDQNEALNLSRRTAELIDGALGT